MKAAGIELHTRRAADLPTLRALRRALEGTGDPVTFTVASSVTQESPAALQESSGETPDSACEVRVVVDTGDSAALARPRRLVVIEDVLISPASFSGSERISDTLATADLVLVPGPARARHLRSLVSGEVVACGLARLDEFWREPEQLRIRARRKLGIPENAQVVLYAPTSDPNQSAARVIEDDIVRITAAGWLVLILPQGWPRAWVERHRALVARAPGLALLDPAEEATALAAADSVVSDGGSLIYEAVVLGKGAIWVQSSGPPGRQREHRYADLGPRVHNAEELERALESERSATPAVARFAAARGILRDEILACEGVAANRMAEEIRSRCLPRPTPSSAPAVSGEDEIFENVEARMAFGDTSGARTALEAHLAAHASARAYRVLASIARREDRLEEAGRALDGAEPLARQELARVLCERANLQVDSNVPEAARSLFEEARRVAPELADPWVGCGSLLLHRGDAVGAEGFFREALAREKSSRVCCGLGLSLVAQNRGREAIPAFEASLDLEADRLAAVFGLVQAAFQCGELEVAELRVAAFVELHSGNLDMLFTLAGLRYQLGNRPGAREMLERIQLFKPDYPGLRELSEKLQT